MERTATGRDGRPAFSPGGAAALDLARSSGWQSRHQLLDVVLALALTAVTVASLLTPHPSVTYSQPDPNGWLVLLALAAGLPLAVRRRWPVTVMVVALAANTAIVWHGWDPDLVSVCLLFGLYAVAAWRSVWVSLCCLVVIYAAMGTVGMLRAPPSYDEPALPDSLIFVVAWSLGLYVRRWRRGQGAAVARAFEAERTRTVVAERAVFAERLRIVRELHDVVSHTLSMIAVQSGTARHLTGAHPERAAPALAAIEDASRTALNDLRRMLGVLRADPPGSPTSAGPVPDGSPPDQVDLGWLGRAWLLDLLFGLALTAVTVSSALTKDPTGGYDYPAPNGWLVLLALVASLPLAVRRRWPALVLVVVLAATSVIIGLGWNKGATPQCLTVALYSAAAWRRRRVAAACLILAYAAMGVLALLRAPYYDSPLALVSAAAFTAFWSIGRYIRHRRLAQRAALARAVQAEHDRALAAERAVLAERLRVARDLHDVVSHTLSVIAVQSAVARHLFDTHPEKAAPALTAIEDASRGALDDLRQMLGVLDDPAQHQAAASLVPTPGLAELELLASTHRAAYGPVELTVESSVRSAPDSLRLTVYRLVQEALTNARKHAPGAPVRVTIQATGDDIVVQVDDDGPRPAPPDTRPAAPPGYGLTGMRERVAMFSGSLRAGPRPDGGFRVHATLRGAPEYAETPR
ncbi:sensor histidine kinase [Pseudofrankia asymbiotica]|uniref:histidine kinase n=1 Tax=Pseudofrankia asymbiotica TaxID=1834516 RepID=A0A1V2I610_9ACTN|nr:histidine kinase [Pseudofrankia asymbiotica]ONH25218.1 hypothetical protein BL253_28015 [Pseudofrankia asymbiotica]